MILNGVDFLFFFIFHFSSWYSMVQIFYSFNLFFPSWYSTCWVSPGKTRKKSGGIFRNLAPSKGLAFLDNEWIWKRWTVDEQWMNEPIEGSCANMGKEENGWNGLKKLDIHRKTAMDGTLGGWAIWVSWTLMMNMERLDNSRKWCGGFRVHPLAN